MRRSVIKHMNIEYINIYNVFLRSVENGKLLQLTIERAKHMGFDAIYFNPFFKTGESKSIYSIADYYSFDELSFDKGAEPEQQVKDIIALCNKNSLRPIIDLVINHTAIDSELIKSNPDFYCYENGNVKLASGRDASQCVVWKDLGQLDYGNPQSGLWDYMLKVCNYYISLGFRGFRCDAADQVAPEFWTWLIHELRKTDYDILFIGEAFLCSTDTRIDLAYTGFEYIYNSAKWWDYKSEWLLNEYNSTCKHIPSISFPDNHDTRRLMDEVDGDVKLFLQRLYFTAFWSQGFEITVGTEFGAYNQLNCVTTRRSHQEERQFDFTEHIKEALKIRRSVFTRYDSNELQQIFYKEDSIQIAKGACGFTVNFRTNEVNVWEHLTDYSNVYTFNCIDSKSKACVRLPNNTDRGIYS